MTMQSDSKGHGLANNLLLQFGLVAVVAVILIALAAYYVWYVTSEAASVGGLVILGAVPNSEASVLKFEEASVPISGTGFSVVYFVRGTNKSST